MPALPASVGQSTCEDCGEALIWAWREGKERKHPPLERAWPKEKFFTIGDDGVVHPLTGNVFMRHVCAPPDIDLP